MRDPGPQALGFLTNSRAVDYIYIYLLHVSRLPVLWTEMAAPKADTGELKLASGAPDEWGAMGPGETHHTTATKSHETWRKMMEFRGNSGGNLEGI